MIAAIPIIDELVLFFQKHGWNILEATKQHIVLTVAAMLIACVIAIPAGIALSHTRQGWLSSAVMGVVSVVQPIPSLAFVAFVAVLFFLLGLPTIGWPVGLVALVAYALLPMLRNTFTGIQQVDPNALEVARGMGMTPAQILFMVELPLSLPFIITGIRISTVWTIGVATLVSLIGAGGLGDLIFQGLDTNHMDYVLAGAAPAAGLALLLDFALGGVEKILVPRGLRERAQRAK